MNKTKLEGKKDYKSCPYCQSEQEGVSEGWGMSPAGWEQLKEKHEQGHKSYLRAEQRKKLSQLLNKI